MEKDTRYMHEIAESYQQDLLKLLAYVPWLEEKKGARVSGTYQGEGIQKTSMAIPVYDGSLMAFVKAAKSTAFLDKNYVYLYTRHKIKTLADEQNIIETAQIQNFEILKGILSKYILGGMVNTKLWPLGVESGILLQVILKMKEIVDFWGGFMGFEEEQGNE